MIRFMDSTDERHVGILVDGKVTEEDMQAIVGLLEESIRKHDQIRVLLQIESLAGVEPKAFLEDLKFSIAHVRDMERAALVGDQGWLAPYARVANAIFPCKVEHFATSDLDEAWRWLRA